MAQRDFGGSSLQALNGLICQLQQPSRTVALRIQGFPGGVGCWCPGRAAVRALLDHDRGWLGGIRLQGGQFHYFFGTNVEDTDIWVVSDTVDMQGGATGFGRDVHFWGGHWESSGIHTARTQSITGLAAVSAGTFTLTFGGDTTAAIAFDATDATIQTALEALPDIDPGDVTVSEVGRTALRMAATCAVISQANTCTR